MSHTYAVVEDVQVRDSFDPTVPDFWVGQKVTLPPLEISAEDWDIPQTTVDAISAHFGKPVLITGIEVEVDGADACYYNMRTSDGYEFNTRFDIFPIEMAMHMGFAGYGHFGDELSLKEHPHYKK